MMMKAIAIAAIKKFPRLTRFARSVRDSLDQNQPIIDTQWGFTLQGNEEMALGRFEPEETRLIRKMLLETDLLVNVGANIGYYCCHALSLGKEVVAVEPIPRNTFYLIKNIDRNDWSTRAEIFPVALGSESGILSIWGSDTGASLVRGWAKIPETFVQQVPVLTLDRVLGNRLQNQRALILVDIEGSEFMMLQGALATLKNIIRPIWMLEITTYQNQPSGVEINPTFLKTFEMFFSHGYRAYLADESRNSELLLADVVKIAEKKRDLKNYNFIFL
jgi:FkbM family methyltransferase